MYTRFKQDRIDAQYLSNMETVSAYFYNWWNRQRRHESFTEMLVESHKIASRGGYVGHTNSDGPQVSPAPGQFRGVDKEAWRPMLKRDWFADVTVGADGYITPRLASVRLLGCHYLIDRPRGYELHLPNESMVPVFLREMTAAMTRLNKGFDAATLANYIQYFVVGHPFERINFSICMAQVNMILWLYGYEPIYHGYLDFDCFIYDHDRVAEIFESKLKRRVLEVVT